MWHQPGWSSFESLFHASAHPFRSKACLERCQRRFSHSCWFSSPFLHLLLWWLAPGYAFARSPIVPSLEADPSCGPHSPLTHLRAVATLIRSSSALFARGGFWNATDPPDVGVIVALHIGLAVSATVKNGDPLLLLFWQLLTQLGHHLFTAALRCSLSELLPSVVGERWDISIMGGCQCTHPLLEILAVIP